MLKKLNYSDRLLYSFWNFNFENLLLLDKKKKKLSTSNNSTMLESFSCEVIIVDMIKAGHYNELNS